MKINKIKQAVKNHAPHIAIASTVVASTALVAAAVVYATHKCRHPAAVLGLELTIEDVQRIVQEDVPMTFHTFLGEFIVSAK